MKFLKTFVPIALLFFASSLIAQIEVQLETYASGFSNIVKIANAGDDRLFVVERSGVIKVIDENGVTLNTPFLDIDNKVTQTGGQSEQGLLGLAFHPDYATNGYFYVHYTDNGGDSQIARYTVSADANVADANSEMIVMEIGQPYGNHNGGDIEFGPDGYLYIGMGDGGSGNDPQNFAQNNQSLLGKMLRVDISTEPYAIPADNPFVNDANVLDEIWSTGLRNPWRFSFDAKTGDMWIADVGQWAYEEIDFQPASSTGGENYGWRCREGEVVNNNVNTSNCGPITDYVQPIWTYTHPMFGPCSITGGFVYRGCTFPTLYGHYLYADYCSGDIWALYRDEQGGVTNEKVLTVSDGAWSTFGQDVNGELYIAGLNNGNVSLIKSGDALTATINEDLGTLSVDGTFDTYQWYLEGVLINGATEATHVAQASGNYTVEVGIDETSCSYLSNEIFVIITSAPDIKGLTSFRIQPNPFEEELLLEMTLDQPKSFELKVYSMDGRIVFEQSLEEGQKWTEKINLAGLESAAYLVRLTNGEEELVRKVIKK